MKVFFSSLIAAIFLVSCSAFEEPVESFLQNYGQIAKVQSLSYSRYPYSSPGWNNVDSSDDLTIMYLINNPGNFPLNASLSVSGVPDLAAAGITLSVLSNYSIAVKYPASFLSTVDMDTGGVGDISPRLYLTRATDGYGQSYDTRMLRCNGRPPFISNALSQSFTDAATGDTDRLIVCFDLPDLPNDVVLLAVTDKRTGTVHSFAINNGVIATGAEANGWSINTVPPGTLEETCPDGPVFYHYEGTDYYITTDVQNLKSLDIFDIELRLSDRGGLTTTRIVESRVQMLDPPTCNISSYSTVYNTYGQPYVEMVVTAPANAPDANLSFYITDENGDLVADVNGNTNNCQGSTSFRLYPKADGTMAQYNVGSISAYKQGWWGRSCYLGTIEVVGLKLDNPVADPAPAAGTNFAQDTVVTVTSPQNADLTWTGSASPLVTDPSPVKITLENPGSNLFGFQATKDYYESSDVVNFTYNVVTTKVYVQSGAPAGGTGTRASPFNDIQGAKTILDANGVTDKSANTIYIMGDFTDMTGSITAGNPSSYYNIVGVDSNGETIQPVELGLAANGSVIEIVTGTISLRAVKITNVDTAANGAVRVIGGTFIIKDQVTIFGNPCGKNVHLASGQVITINQSNLSGTKVGVNTATAPTGGIPVPVTSGYAASGVTDDPSDHFVSDTSGQSVIYNTGKTDAVLAVNGGGIDIGTTYSVAFADSASAGVHTFTATATPTSGGGSPIDITGDITSWSMKLYYLNAYTNMSSSGTAAAGGNSMDISGQTAGTYIMKITVVYGGKTYSGEVEVTVAGP
ncbi:MAG: hypothetical protein J6V90_07700 [Treponema sp.]|nr:hypothetical protein [Treponema sp.]